MNHQSAHEVHYSHMFEAKNLNDALLMWLHIIGASEEFNGVQVADAERSEDDETRTWHAHLADKSDVSVVIRMLDDDTAKLTVTHQGLADISAGTEWQTYWRELLAGL